MSNWLKERPKRIKWWFQRANGKLPECDIWDYYATLIPQLRQALEYLLREDGARSWESDKESKKERKDLEFALEWLKKAEHCMLERFPVPVSSDKQCCPEVIQKGGVSFWDDGHFFYYTKEWGELFEKDQMKTFKILGKYLWSLWD